MFGLQVNALYIARYFITTLQAQNIKMDQNIKTLLFRFAFPVFPVFLFSSHSEPDAEGLQGEHVPPPQADRHHVEGPLCQGAAPDQGQGLSLCLILGAEG